MTLSTTDPAVVTLGDGEFPCPACGIATTPQPPAEPETLTILGVDNGRALRMYTAREREGVQFTLPTLQVARCTECAARREQAWRLLDAHPKVTARLGSPDVAARRLTGALDALAILATRHVTTLAVERLTASGERLMRLIDALAVPGIASMWSAQFAPVQMPTARVGTAARVPWSHEVQTDALAAGYAAVLAATSDVTARLVPPADGSPRGCLMCGVGHVTAPAGTRPEHVWTLVSVDPSALGGRRSPQRVRGYLCPACTDAKDVVGSLGPTTLSRAVMAHLGLRQKFVGGEVLDGLVGWAAQATATPPSDDPWGHTDLDAVAEALGAG